MHIRFYCIIIAYVVTDLNIQSPKPQIDSFNYEIIDYEFEDTSNFMLQNPIARTLSFID